MFRSTSTARVMVVFVLAVSATVASATPHHRLSIRLDPVDGTMHVTDSISLSGLEPDENGAYRFVLHAGLEPTVVSDGWTLEAAGVEQAARFAGINAASTTTGRVDLEAFRLSPGPDAEGPVMVRYGGRVAHALATSGEEYQRSFSETPGLIDARGVFLAGTSYWVPTFGDGLVTFDLTVTDLTPPWDVVSQGRRIVHETTNGSRKVTWRCPHPQEEIYLVAGPWHEYSAEAGEVRLYAFLRDADAGLATRYLDATERFLQLYESLLPPFPYGSFALVENFWETGYGMPGFTLLGPRVIRFPWILRSSYPHELLHNWWGNSVYVDFDRGNWCEGLTAYMADHLFAEQRGEGRTHRRTILKKFTDFVDAGNDFPLVEFGSRHSAASEAVGYGKSLMLFHMIRRAVGDDAFVQAMSRFYDANRFRRASFEDVAQAVEHAAGGEWGPFFDAWTHRVGAPRLEVQHVRAEETPEGSTPWAVSVRLRQETGGEPFPLTVPVAVTVEGADDPVRVEAGSCGANCTIRIPCPARPLRVDVDPDFDVMRRLGPYEVPPALSTVFGADRPLFVLPADADKEERAAWRDLARRWAEPETPELVDDTELGTLTENRSAWVLGWSNRFRGEVLSRLRRRGVSVDSKEIRLPSRTLNRAGHSVVAVSRAEVDPSAAIAVVAADPTAAIRGLARKLPHYSRYGYLAFSGDEPENVAKGLWETLDSPLVHRFDHGSSAPRPVDERSPLAALPSAFDGSRMLRTVRRLADPSLEGRGLGTPGLARATDWVEAQMEALELRPAGDDGYRRSWSWTGGDPARRMRLVNLVAEIPGSDPNLTDRPVLVMAHLDHLGRGWPDARSGNVGLIHPGADDNASGVAVLLELARALVEQPPHRRPILLAVVTGEEAGLLGSRRLVAGLGEAGAPFACLNLDTVGRLADGALYVLNADSAREWRFLWMGVAHTLGTDIDIVDEPLDASDQVACLEAGIPAVQLFTGPTADYHRPTDTADTIDPDGMATVAEAAYEAVAYLADREEPLTVTLGEAQTPVGSSAGPHGERRAGLGTVPDFGFGGPGVRVQQVVPGSPAESAGVRPGDVILSVDGARIEDLRGLAETLRGHDPGERVSLTIRRDGRDVEIPVVLDRR